MTVPRRYRQIYGTDGHGWYDTVNNVAFDDRDTESLLVQEFITWRNEGNDPDTYDAPTGIDAVDFGNAVPTRDQLKNAVDLVRAYINNTAPTDAQRKQFENVVGRLVLFCMRQIING